MERPLSVSELSHMVTARAGEDSPVDRLRHAVELAEQLHELGDQVVDRFVREARRAGCSWAEIGSVLGVSKQAAQQRFVAQPAVPDIVPERFTDSARRAIERGVEEARALGHNYLGTEHVLLGLVAEPDDIAAAALASLGATGTAVREWIGEHCGVCDSSDQTVLRVMPRMRHALELACGQAAVLGHDRAGSEHLLLAIVHVKGALAARILADLDVTDERLRDQLGSILGVDSSRLAAGVRPRRRRLRRPTRLSS